jgi:hypothetical protein
MHGSCRKPHHPGGDGLAQADRLLCELVEHGLADHPNDHTPSSLLEWPSLLMLTGDQIYADDVAGPMLQAIHQVVGLLGLPNEQLPPCALPTVTSAQDLYTDPNLLYRRETLLPQLPDHQALLDVLFGGVKKPIFTTDSAHNHLITLGEVLAMYALVWSPVLWPCLDLTPPATLPDQFRQKYAKEQEAFDNGKEILLGTNKYPNKNDKMKHDLELYPFVKQNPRKTLITPVIEKRLAEKLEQERLSQEE